MGPSAQQILATPDGLDLNDWIFPNEHPSTLPASDDSFSHSFSSHTLPQTTLNDDDLVYRRSAVAPAVSSQIAKTTKDNPFYLKDSERTPPSFTFDVDSIPIVHLKIEDLNPSNASTFPPLHSPASNPSVESGRKSRSLKEKRSRKAARRVVEVYREAGEMPEKGEKLIEAAASVEEDPWKVNLFEDESSFTATPLSPIIITSTVTKDEFQSP